ncbi:MAG: DegT/DnrJ/EryC1/StrS family aminotransferase, partial [Pirellulaceae bacterium]
MLLKGPQSTETFSDNLVFTPAARNAWQEILRRVTSWRGRPVKLLLPAYIGETDREGSGVFDPVRATSSQFSFYSITNRLQPIFEDIENSIKSGSIDILLVIHYFGFIKVDLEQLKELCQQHDVVLVEDCAHCCYLESGLPGSRGDFGFYSLHKFFPTGTGGILRTNTARPELESDNQAGACEPGVLEQVIRTRTSEVIKKRRENYLYLFDALASVAGVTALWKLDETTVPHNFPIYVEADRREQLYFHLQERGLPTIALYYRLVDEIDQEQFPDSFDLAHNILNLPVHQDTDISDLEMLVREIESFLES